MKTLNRVLVAAFVSLGMAVACTDSPFFCPGDFGPGSGGGTSSCGWFSCQDIPNLPMPAPPPVAPCGYGCQ